MILSRNSLFLDVLNGKKTAPIAGFAEILVSFDCMDKV